MTMTMSMSSYPASMSSPSRLSLVSGPASPPLAEPEVDYPVFTEEEYRALMLAEFGALVPLLSHDEVQATMMLANDDEEIQSQETPLLRENESHGMIGEGDETEMQACPPCPDDSKSRKKRKKPSPPPQEDDFEEPSPRSSKRAKEEMEELPSPRATNKIMASCLLKRRHGAPGQTIIWCQCKELPGDSPCCALHQEVRFRSWMLEQGDGEIPAAGSGDGVLVPTRRTESKKKVLTYIRWRSRVWMPSRFYVERASRQG